MCANEPTSIPGGSILPIMNDSARFPIPVLLMECFLAGFCRCAAEKYWDRLAIGEMLGLAREPANPHDPRAVRVHWHGHMVGYLPSEANFTVAQMLDRGEYVEARIADKRSHAIPGTHILLEVIALADPTRRLPPLQTRPDEEQMDPGRGLAWTLAIEAIGKAKALR